MRPSPTYHRGGYAPWFEDEWEQYRHRNAPNPDPSPAFVSYNGGPSAYRQNSLTSYVLVKESEFYHYRDSNPRNYPPPSDTFSPDPTDIAWDLPSPENDSGLPYDPPIFPPPPIFPSQYQQYNSIHNYTPQVALESSTEPEYQSPYGISNLPEIPEIPEIPLTLKTLLPDSKPNLGESGSRLQPIFGKAYVKRFQTRRDTNQPKPFPCPVEGCGCSYKYPHTSFPFSVFF